MSSTNSIRQKLSDLALEEEKWAKKYEDLIGETNMSNIRMFLDAFARSRNEFSRDINDLLNKKYVINNENKTLRKLLRIQSTGHLLNSENIDPNSLQNILLYISKAETETYANYEKVLAEMEDGPLKKMFSNIWERRERVMLKADNIYHDMIVTKV